MNVLFIESPTLNGTFEPVIARLRAEGSDVRLASPASLASDPAPLWDAQLVVTGSAYQLDAATLRRATRLLAVAYGAIGTDGIDLQAATEAGIAVAHAPTHPNYTSMAEATVLLMLALLYDLERARDLMHRGGPRPATITARMLEGRTVGLVGIGRIARAVASRLAPWGVRLLACRLRPELEIGMPGIELVSLDALLADSDVVSLHAAYRAGAAPLLGAREFGRMRPGSLLVNTARGGLVDEAALCAALQSGHLAGAALDTFAAEPLPSDSPLREAPRVLLTPHCIGHTQELMASLQQALQANVAALLAGSPPPYLRNPEVLPRWRARIRASRS
ncbi:MAG: NAD(P)-dependent oxidoreductase [Lautropia sp.]